MVRNEVDMMPIVARVGESIIFVNENGRRLEC